MQLQKVIPEVTHSQKCHVNKGKTLNGYWSIINSILKNRETNNSWIYINVPNDLAIQPCSENVSWSSFPSPMDRSWWTTILATHTSGPQPPTFFFVGAHETSGVPVKSGEKNVLPSCILDTATHVKKSQSLRSNASYTLDSQTYHYLCSRSAW
jgi:hypothetical protein